MAVNRNFRTCPSTGLVYHEPAEKLIRWNAVAGVVSLLVGGVLDRFRVVPVMIGNAAVKAAVVLFVVIAEVAEPPFMISSAMSCSRVPCMAEALDSNC